jgi:hypothetical protein
MCEQPLWYAVSVVEPTAQQSWWHAVSVVEPRAQSPSWHGLAEQLGAFVVLNQTKQGCSISHCQLVLRRSELSWLELAYRPLLCWREQQTRVMRASLNEVALTHGSKEVTKHGRLAVRCCRASVIAKTESNTMSVKQAAQKCGRRTVLNNAKGVR